MTDNTLITPRTATVEIFTGDYLDRIEYLAQQAEAAKDAAQEDGPRLASDIPEYLELAREHDALVAEAKAAAFNVKVQALGRRAWKELVAAHPPRQAGNGVTEAQAKLDAQEGVNLDSFKDALVEASIIEPEGIKLDDLDQLAAIDFDRIYFTAFALNRVPSADPKASLVSRLTQTSEETSS